MKDENEEKKSFNDVIDHLHKIEGNVTAPTDAKLKNMPKPIKYIGYFIIFFFVITFLLIFILNLVQ